MPIASGRSTRSLATYESRAFLEAEMRKPRGGPLVVVTHHAPHPGRSFQHQSERLSDEEILTAAYRSDLTSLMWPAPIEGGRNSLRPADLWIYGHTHESEDVTIGYTRVVSNAKGYGPWAPSAPRLGQFPLRSELRHRDLKGDKSIPIKTIRSSSQVFLAGEQSATHHR